MDMIPNFCGLCAWDRALNINGRAYKIDWDLPMLCTVDIHHKQRRLGGQIYFFIKINVEVEIY